MALSEKTLRDPMKAARGLGSAKHGAEHWWMQRLTALALVPLTIWFVAGIIAHAGASREAVVAWMGNPISATLMILTIGASFHHGQAGLQVVYEDYVHHEGLKLTAIIATKFAAYAFAAVGIVAVLKLSFGA
jgi:succinate dehydrogenase / fumarate reductase, membrane anchor subunit